MPHMVLCESTDQDAKVYSQGWNRLQPSLQPPPCPPARGRAQAMCTHRIPGRPVGAQAQRRRQRTPRPTMLESREVWQSVRSQCLRREPQRCALTASGEDLDMTMCRQSLQRNHSPRLHQPLPPPLLSRTLPRLLLGPSSSMSPVQTGLATDRPMYAPSATNPSRGPYFPQTPQPVAHRPQPTLIISIRPSTLATHMNIHSGATRA